MLECALCAGDGDCGVALAHGRPGPKIGSSGLVVRGEVAAISVAGAPCHCYMPDCVRCFGGEVDAPTTPSTGIVAASGDTGAVVPLTGTLAAGGRA